MEGEGEIEERRMFGGLTFMLDEKMCCGVEKERLIVRVLPDQMEELLSRPDARPMDLTGRPLKGFLYVEPTGVAGSKNLNWWLRHAIAFVHSKPARNSAEGGSAPRKRALVASRLKKTATKK